MIEEGCGLKFSEWVASQGSRVTGNHGVLTQRLVSLLTPGTDVTLSVVDRQEKRDGNYAWRYSFILLTDDRLITGHGAFRVATQSDNRQGLEFAATAIPRSDIAAVSFYTYSPENRGGVETGTQFSIQFRSGRTPLVLAIDQEGIDGQTSTEYSTLGYYLMNQMPFA